MFTPRFKKAKGRFLKKKSSGHVDTEAMARYNTTKILNFSGKKQK